MITYNHEKFIAQAIESVLMQETDFPVELIIGEDCSTDSTRQIVKAYAEKHPDVIRALLPERNLGMQRNGAAVLQACRGEYVSPLEGDDYWTAPDKLQRQVEFLTTHPELSLCHHAVEYVRWEGGARHVLQSFPPESCRGTRQAMDLIGGNFIQTCSLMLRRDCLPAMDASFLSLKLGDWPICYLVAERGGIGFLDKVMADYRIHDSNCWNALASVTRQYETARMAFYLATVAKPVAQAAWHQSGLDLIRLVLEKQSTLLGAIRKALAIWLSGCLPLSQALRLLTRDMKNRLNTGLRRHPRAFAVLKRMLHPYR